MNDITETNTSRDVAINSMEYWESRFHIDWESKSGREQSRFFSEIAFYNLDEKLKSDIYEHNLSICDWGCAQGDGTADLKENLGLVNITGVDFSDEAISKANKAYPNIPFLALDFLNPTTQTEQQWDILFSSNTLEHFTNPWEVLRTLSTRARKHIILLLPYREEERISEHFYTFNLDTILIEFDNWVLADTKIVDASALSPCYWNGQQILLTYTNVANPGGLITSGLADNETAIELALEKRKNTILGEQARKYIGLLDNVSQEEEGKLSARLGKSEQQLAKQLALSNSLTRRLEMTQAELKKSHDSITKMLASSSWRLTKPMRFVFRVLRHGISSSDKQALKTRGRSYLNRLPLPDKVKAAIKTAVRQSLSQNKQKGEYSKSEVHPQDPSFVSVHPAPTPKKAGIPDYIIWGVIDWHFRHQRPQQLAQAIAQSGRRVFYVSVNLVDDDRAGFNIEQLDDSGMLFQIFLYAKGAPVVYTHAPSETCVTQLRNGIGEILLWANSEKIVSLVQHSFWHNIASAIPNSVSVYDCMDHHEGFGTTSEDILMLEKALLRESDLTITTSGWLDNIVAPHASNRIIIRNAGEFSHFSTSPRDVYHDLVGRKIIGYYGAIAEWFDLDLVAKIATAFPEQCVLLIGADTVDAKNHLSKHANVVFLGEIPYQELPIYLHAFDVCLLPFKVIPLTLATNPVKVYEYLSAGKPVVCVDLPEVAQFENLVIKASDANSFIAGVATCLDTPSNASDIEQRQAFAKEQTWMHRATALIEAAETLTISPFFSVIVVTYNNIELTKACLTSLDEHCKDEHIEIIVVDNASVDGTPEFLAGWKAGASNRKIILNTDNRGFAAANNQGLAVASGEYLTLLNNDTYVTPGWLRTLSKHLAKDKTIGLIGPVTNNIGNEAKINISYSNMEEMLFHAKSYTSRHIGQTFTYSTAAFFCVMMPRKTYEHIGPLDEAFGRGFFEDDDYCRRIEQNGLKVSCAEDVFIHHQLSASFNKLKAGERQGLFETNKAIYEKKWGKWVPHEYKSRN